MTFCGWAALDYASVNWPVFLLEPNSKRPHGRLAPHGLHDATTDPDQIRSWFRKAPDAGLGIVTGHRSRLVVFDVDGVEGLNNWDSLMADGREEIASSFTVVTPRGSHTYLLHPGRPVPNSAGKLAPNIDVRGDGGYVVAPPTTLQDGRCWRQWTGEGCEGWLDGTAQLAPMPEWVSPPVQLAARGQSEGCSPAKSIGRYGQTALDAECGRVALAPVGQRNDTLNRAAFSLGQLVGGGVLEATHVVGVLLEVAARAGLSNTEAERTIASGLAKGRAQPRSVAA